MKNIYKIFNFRSFNEKGFSFLELMVVVVILGILATYIAPRFMGRAEDAKAVKAKVDIAALETSLKLYKLDNSHYPRKKDILQRQRSRKIPGAENIYIFPLESMAIMILFPMVLMELLEVMEKTKILTAGTLNNCQRHLELSCVCSQ